MAHRIGSLIQITLNASMGVICTRVGLNLRVVSASLAGAVTKSHNLSVKMMLTTNATPTPIRARMMRDRSSSRCSRKDMRSM